MEIENKLSKIILDCAFRIHTEIGPGLLENIYKTCLTYELTQSGLLVETEKIFPFVYKEITFDCGYRIDILVENKVIIETKNVDCLTDVHFAQTLTYMKLSGCKLGLILNFKTKSLKDGIKRLVL